MFQRYKPQRMFSRHHRESDRSIHQVIAQWRKPDSLAKDRNLIQLSEEFSLTHGEWVERFERLSDSDADCPEMMTDVHDLSRRSRRVLSELSALRPWTHEGAIAKLRAVALWFEWNGGDAGCADNAAGRLMARAQEELRSFQDTGEIAIANDALLLEMRPPMAWLDRLARRLWSSETQRRPTA